MTSKDIALLIKTGLERDSAFSETADVGFQLQYNENIAIATVEKFVEGKWRSFKVIVQSNGEREDDLRIESKAASV